MQRRLDDIDSINSRLFGVKFDFSVIKPNIDFWLKTIIELRNFQNGKPGDTITGYGYECVDTKYFETYVFKIEGQKKPLMTNEELQAYIEDGQRVSVEFVNPTIMAYANVNAKSILDSYKADDVKLVEEK